MTRMERGVLPLTLLLIILGAADVCSAVTPPAPQLVSPESGKIVTIDTLTLTWNSIPHDNGYYWISYIRAELKDTDSWVAPPVSRIHGTQTTISKEYLRDTMVYNTAANTDTFYWRVQAEVDPGYYWPESWSPQSEAWSFSVLKWPAAWVDGSRWEGYTRDHQATKIDGATYLKLIKYGNSTTGAWQPVGSGDIPVTASKTARLSWTDRKTDEQPKDVAFADYYRVQLAASSTFDKLIITSATENIYYDTPELQPGVYYWRVRSERNDGLVTDWTSPRQFIIAETPTNISCTVSSSSPALGSPVTISGYIVPAYPQTLVTISYMSDGSWSTLGTVTTGSDGGYSYSWTPSSPGSYQFKASWEGGDRYSGSTSEVVEVTVKTPTTITCSVSSSEVTVGSSVTVSGSISPAVSGATITLTYTKPDATPYVRTEVTESGGSYSDSYKPDVTGSWSVKVSWEGDATHVGATSSSTSFTVKKSGCFIATATFGSELAPQVQFLRGFRDNTVLGTFAGSSFMTVFNGFYYSFSPGVASIISDNGALREVMKVILYPLIGILSLSSVVFSLFTFSPELGVVVTGLVASSLIGVVYVAPLALLLSMLKKFRLSSKIIRLTGLVWAGNVVLTALAEALVSPPLMMVATGAFVILTICFTTLVVVRAVMQRVV